MSYVLSAVSDRGSRHSVNQDSVLARKMQTSLGEMVFACICDGMGGLQYGELASATVISRFDEWLDNDLPLLTGRTLCENDLRDQWQKILAECRTLLDGFTVQTGATLGTTLTAVLFWKKQYFFANIGDTRIYEINGKVRILSHDHTFVQREIDAGRMTPEQAACSGKEHILTRCIGVGQEQNADFYQGQTQKALYLLCSDGFRHKINADEIQSLYSGKALTADRLEKELRKCVDQCRARGERDDISAVSVLVG